MQGWNSTFCRYLKKNKTNLDPKQDPKEKNCFSDLYKSAENSFYGFKVELLLFKKVLYLPLFLPFL